jgi:hypothetical protein
MLRLTLGILLAAVALASPAAAQEQTGAIQGVVKDTQGGVLPGVTVEVKNLATGAVQTVVTDPQGRYRVPSMPPGRYEVTADLSGFGPAKMPVTLNLGQLLAVDLTLAVAGLSETVNVSGDSPLIDVKQNATYSTVQSEQIDRIPKGRDFTNVLAAAPGANDERRAGGISIDGASGAENRFVVDGVDTTNLQDGSSAKGVVPDFIQEVQVKTSGYPAEYAGATGGVVNAVTKSGTNVFRGSAGVYYSQNGPAGLENKDKANFWMGKQRPYVRLKPSDTRQAEWATYPLDEIPNVEPVLEGGGPIVRNKLWYYVGYSPLRKRTTRTVTWATPVAGGPATEAFVREDPSDRLIASASWQVSNSLRAKFSYTPTWTRQRGSLPNNEPDGTSTDNAATDFRSVGENKWDASYSGTIDWSARPDLYVNLAGGYFMADKETLGTGTEIIHEMNGNISVFPGVPASLIQPNGYMDNKDNDRTVTDKLARLYLNATGTYFKSWFGQHALKAGVRFERIGNTRDIGQVQPTITFYWDQTYVDANGIESRGPYGYYRVSRGVLGIGDIHSNNWGLFLQDSWSPSSRLTINAGVRAESERIPYYSPGQEDQGITFGFGDKIAPRLGFAYDVRGNGRWKAYGSFSRLFDITKLELPRGSFGGEQWKEYYYTLNTYDWPSVNCQENDPACPGRLLEVSALRFGSNDVNNPETAAVTTRFFGAPRNMIQDDIKPVQSQEVTLGLDHELNAVTSVGVRYTHKWVTRTIEDFGFNLDGTEYYFIGNPGQGYIGQLRFLWGETGPTGFTPEALYQPINGKVFPQVAPRRDYDAVELSVKKRLSKRWSGSAVYTWSRLYGNFPGLASSDEVSTTRTSMNFGKARLSPNVNRMYDGPWMMYDSRGNPVYGNLNTDRPHYLKLQGTYDMPWGTGVGVNWYARSGALFSKWVTYQGYQYVYYEGRGSLGRTPVEQAVDLLVQHDFRLGQKVRLNLSLNVANLLDTSTATSIYSQQFRDAFNLTPTESFFSAWDPTQVAAGNSRIRPDPRMYGGVTPTASVDNYRNVNPMENLYMNAREVRVGMRLSF